MDRISALVLVLGVSSCRVGADMSDPNFYPGDMSEVYERLFRGAGWSLLAGIGVAALAVLAVAVLTLYGFYLVASSL